MRKIRVLLLALASLVLGSWPGPGPAGAGPAVSDAAGAAPSRVGTAGADTVLADELGRLRRQADRLSRAGRIPQAQALAAQGRARAVAAFGPDHWTAYQFELLTAAMEQRAGRVERAARGIDRVTLLATLSPPPREVLPLIHCTKAANDMLRLEGDDALVASGQCLASTVRAGERRAQGLQHSLFLMQAALALTGRTERQADVLERQIELLLIQGADAVQRLTGLAELAVPGAADARALAPVGAALGKLADLRGALAADIRALAEGRADPAVVRRRMGQASLALEGLDAACRTLPIGCPIDPRIPRTAALGYWIAIGDLARARAEADKLAGLETAADVSPVALLTYRLHMAMLNEREGRTDEALRQVAAGRALDLDGVSPLLATGRSLLTIPATAALARAGRLPAALQEARAHRQGLVAFIETFPDESRADRYKPLFDHLQLYLRLLQDVGLSRPAEAEALAGEAFEVLQIGLISRTISDLRRFVARGRFTDPRSAGLARDAQDLGRRLDALLEVLAAGIRESGTPEGEARLIARADEGVRLASLRRDINRQIALLEGQRPLDRERIVAAAEVRGQLRDDEALLAILPGRADTSLVLVRRDRTVLARSGFAGDRLNGAVERLRRSLDNAGAETGQVLLEPVDTAAAASLYLALLGPVEGHLAGVRRLVLSVNGRLAELPFPALLTARTEAGTAPADYRAMPWLVRRFSLAVVPSASAFVALRRDARPAEGRVAFAGFGDPVLTGGRASAGGPGPAERPFFQPGTHLGDPAALREELPPLPEARTELLALARALGSGAQAVRSGADASEQRVKQTALADVRVLAFATHALMTPRSAVAGQPALVLTPPGRASVEDDGLLTMSEVARLRLNADLVVLSACNTGAPDGRPDGDALSGLIRAFFFAGARNVIATHWRIDSQATVALMAAFATARGGGARPAEALRRAQEAALGSERAHPYYWAAFFLAGRDAE